MLALLLLAALDASPKVLAPASTITIADRELHHFARCDETLAVSAGKTLAIGRLDLAKQRFTAKATEPVEAWALVFTPGCGFLLTSESTGARDARVHGASVRSAKNASLVQPIDTFPLPVSSLDVSPDGAFVAVATNGGTLFVYSLDKKGTTKRVFEAPKLPKGDLLLRVRFAKGHLVGGSYQGLVLAWPFDAATGALGPAQNLMARVGPTRAQGSLDVATGAVVMPGGARVLELAVSNEGARVFAAVESGAVFAWKLDGPSPARVTLVEGLEGANQLAISADGALLAASGNFVARLYKVSGDAATLAAELGGLMHIDTYVLVRQLTFSGKRLVAGTGDLSTGKLLVFQP